MRMLDCKQDGNKVRPLYAGTIVDRLREKLGQLLTTPKEAEEIRKAIANLEKKQ